VGTGVGGGLILDGELHDGRGAAGEIGHLVVKPGDAPAPVVGRAAWRRMRGARGSRRAYARSRRADARRACSRS
jgi:glucokinase